MNHKYDQYLLNEIVTIAILLSILVAVIIVITCFGIKYFKNQQRNNALACLMCSSILIGVVVISCSSLIPYISDLKNQAYIKYDGEFYVEDGDYDLRTGAQPLVRFSKSEEAIRYKVCDDAYLQDGYHQGYIIYSKDSKVIVEWHCDDCN